MRWTQQALAHYIGRARTVVEFEGVTEEGLTAALRQEALRRIKAIEETVFNDEMTDKGKADAVIALLEDGAKPANQNST